VCTLIHVLRDHLGSSEDCTLMDSMYVCSSEVCAGIFKQSMGAVGTRKNRVVITGGIGSLESILGLLKSSKIRAQYLSTVAGVLDELYIQLIPLAEARQS
jgi:hypothetical protein